MTLGCDAHGHKVKVRCNRWRKCPGCSLFKQWEIKQRFEAGIDNVPDDRYPAFVTLTFPKHRAPDEEEAHKCLRKLIGRLRYRGDVGEYGWVLQRQENGTLHYHGIWHMRWYADGLVTWRNLVEKSGFGTQQHIRDAERDDARYCARYLSQRLAELTPMRRAYSFSRGYPLAPSKVAWLKEKQEVAALGVPDDCEWRPLPYG